MLLHLNRAPLERFHHEALQKFGHIQETLFH